MASWSGWESEFQTAAQVVHTADNKKFLDDWHSHAETNCRNNPIDLSAETAGHSNCSRLPGLTARAQNYTTHGNAAHAFYVQLNRSGFKAILDALESGDPYTVDDTGQVAEQLTAWGSQTFAHVYFNETANAPGRGGGIVTTDAFKGWKDLQVSLNRHMQASLAHSDRQTRRALRALGRARKVKL